MARHNMSKGRIKRHLKRMANDIYNNVAKVGTYQYNGYEIELRYFDPGYFGEKKPECSCKIERNHAQKIRYHKRLGAGLCVRCGKNLAEEGKTRCKTCRIKQNKARTTGNRPIKRN